MRRNQLRREGTVVVAVAVSLVGLLGFLALSLDGGMVLEKKRTMQGAADAAALAAASELYAKAFTEPTGRDPDGSIKTFAKLIAEENGFKDGVGGVSVTVNIPPTSGQFSGQAFHAEVTITGPQAVFFSKIYSGATNNVAVKARAVGRGRNATSGNGIIALDPLQSGSVRGVGNAEINVVNASVLVNSTSASGMEGNGHPKFSATNGFFLSGTPGYSGGTITGTIRSGVAPTPDPLRFLPEPTKPAAPVGNTATTLNPGYYSNGISLSGQTIVTMNPGIYYIEGGVKVTGKASINGTGVMIFNKTSDIQIAGQGTVNLSPPTTGPYAGMVLFQARSNTTEASITGNGDWNVTGGMYLPNANLKSGGNGDTSIGSQLIANTFSTNGNGQLNVVYNAALVPRFRDLCLVE